MKLFWFLSLCLILGFGRWPELFIWDYNTILWLYIMSIFFISIISNNKVPQLTETLRSSKILARFWIIFSHHHVSLPNISKPRITFLRFPTQGHNHFIILLVPSIQYNASNKHTLFQFALQITNSWRNNSLCCSLRGSC